MTDASDPKKVSVSLVAVPEVAAWVLHGFYEVLSFVGPGWGYLTGWPQDSGRMVPRIIAEDRSAIRNGTGIAITPDLTFAEVGRTDIVIVPDLGISFDEETRGRWPAAAAWIRQQHETGALVCSACTGSLLLAEAGLLDGKEATCHWAATEAMRAHYPNVRLRPERVLVAAGGYL
jgi:transcriptional regulator GlxA family with amidase domain